MKKHVMVLGTTEPQDFVLEDDDGPLNGTGYEVAVEFRSGQTVSAAWLNASAGTVRVTETEAMPLGEDRFRFKLTDQSGAVGYVPNLEKESGRWLVVRV
jgi:hypothetical protein